MARSAQVQAFLEAFADEFDLRRHIRFRTRVVRVDPLGPSGMWGAGPWAVTAEPVGSGQACSPCPASTKPQSSIASFLCFAGLKGSQQTVRRTQEI